MSQVNAALHCFFPCWYREAPRAEPPPAASRTGRASTGGQLALRHANDRAPRSDIVKDQPAPTAQARRRFTRRRSGPDMIVTASWRRHGHSQHAASSSTSGTTDSGSEKTPPPLTPSPPLSSPASADPLQINVIYGHDLRSRYWHYSPPPRYSPGLAHRITEQSSGREGGIASPGAIRTSAHSPLAKRQASEEDAPPRRCAEGA